MLSSVKQKIKDQKAKYNLLIRQGEKIPDNLSMCAHLKNAVMFPSGQSIQVMAKKLEAKWGFFMTLSLSHLQFLLWVTGVAGCSGVQL